jgi:hypothetical protein
MITLINGYVQNPAGLIVPNGSIKLQLNVDATIIAAPYGFVAANVPVVFQFNAACQIQPNPPAVAAKIWSNEELQPQLSSTLLGTYYLVTFYDQNGAVLNATPLWWQFPESAGATVDISQMTAISTVGGNIIYYPTAFGGSGTVTSVAFVGDGVILSATPSTPVTVSGDITATLLTQSNNLVFAGPIVGPAGLPTFRFLVAADVNPAFDNATPATALLNQSSPLLIQAGTYWNGAASAADFWSWQDVIGAGTNPASTLTLVHSGSPSVSNAISMPFAIAVGVIQSNGMSASGNVNVLNGSGYNMQAPNGGEQNIGQASELITLSLSGTTSDSVTNLLPAGAIIDAVVALVVTTISGGSTPTTWEIGDATTAARFTSTGTALTAGSTVIGLNQMTGSVSTTAAGPTQAAAAKVRITLDQIPGQGQVRVTVFYRQFTAPTS